MRCEAITELLALHLDGALDAEQARAVEAHLATCPACAAALASLRATVALLHGLAPAPMPDGLPRTVIARLATAAGEPHGRVIRLGLNRPAIRIALAAGLLIMASVYVVNRTTDDAARAWPRSPEQMPTHAANVTSTKKAVPAAAPFADAATVADASAEMAPSGAGAPVAPAPSAMHETVVVDDLVSDLDAAPPGPTGRRAFKPHATPPAVSQHALAEVDPLLKYKRAVDESSDQVSAEVGAGGEAKTRRQAPGRDAAVAAPLPEAPRETRQATGMAAVPGVRANTMDFDAGDGGFEAETGIAPEPSAPTPNLGLLNAARRETEGAIWQDKLRAPDNIRRIDSGLSVGAATGVAGPAAPAAPPRSTVLAKAVQPPASLADTPDEADKSTAPARRLRAALEDEEVTEAVAAEPRDLAPPPGAVSGVAAAPRIVTVMAARRAAVETVIARYGVSAEASAGYRAKTVARTRRFESGASASTVTRKDASNSTQREDAIVSSGAAPALHEEGLVAANWSAETLRDTEFPRGAESPEEPERNRRKADLADTGGLVVYVTADELPAFLAELAVYRSAGPVSPEPLPAIDAMALVRHSAVEKESQRGASDRVVGAAGGPAKERADPTALVPVRIVFE